MATYKNEIKDAGVYIDPLSDWGWKTLFGSKRYKEHLISFINAVYPELEVTDISYDNVEYTGDKEEARSTRLDLVCTTAKGEAVMVEVQKAEQKCFFERGLWTSSFKIREQAKQGPWDYHLKGVYSIGILTFPPEKIADFDWNDDAYIHTFSLREDVDGRRMTSLYRFAYIAVAKFSKDAGKLDNILEKWLYLLKNLRRLEARPKELQDRVFEMFFRAAEIARLPEEKQQTYRESIMNENDWMNAMAFAEEKGEKRGRAEGLEAGREEGRAEGRAEVAKTMLENGLDPATISKYTGLSPEQLEALRVNKSTGKVSGTNSEN